MNAERNLGPVETFRWKGARRHVLGLELPLHAPDGSTRATVEGGWLAVVYPEDRRKAYVEAVERAEATREFSRVQGSGRNSQEDVAIVSRFRLDSSVGSFEWNVVPDRSILTVEAKVRTHPFLVTRPGILVLPDGQRETTVAGTGFFDVPGLVHAYEPWRDAEVAGGWAAIIEVSLEAPAEWRPLLASLPLLLFTSPPGLFD